MQDDILISVITVCYNSEATLSHTLQSVADQDWPWVEHIVIDGNSLDGSLAIIECFRPQIAYVVSEPDDGIYDAMNKGLERAKGDIVCFLNADDYYASNTVLSEAVLEIKKFKLDVLFGDVGFIKKSGDFNLVRRYRSDRFTPSRLGWGWMPAHPALFLRKEVIQRVGRFNTNYQIAGDFEFVIRIFHNQSLRYKYYNKILVLMKTGGVSDGGWRSKIQLNKEVLRACRENGVRSNIFMLLSKYPRKLMEFF